jgi:hypothetical protein
MTCIKEIIIIVYLILFSYYYETVYKHFFIFNIKNENQ